MVTKARWMASCEGARQSPRKHDRSGIALDERPTASVMRPSGSSEVSIAVKSSVSVNPRGGNYTYVAVEPHAVMMTETGQPREYQAKAGHSGAPSGRTAAPPPDT